MNLNLFDLFSVDCFSEDDDAMDVDSGSAPKPKTDDLAEYNLDEYDDDTKTLCSLCRSRVTLNLWLRIFSATGPFSNIKGLTYYKDNEEDPYITLKDVCSNYSNHFRAFRQTCQYCMQYRHFQVSFIHFHLENDEHFL